MITNGNWTSGDGFAESTEVYFLQCHAPEILWWEYAKQVGPEELKASFGWEVPPPDPRFGETVYRVFSTVHQRWQVGWASIRRDPVDPTMAFLSRAVVPEARRRGFRVAMGEAAVPIAKSLGIEWLMLEILATNRAHLERQQREAEAGGPWRQAGFRHLPPPSCYLFARDLRE